MKKSEILALNEETFRCYWFNKPQPVGAFTKEAVKQYRLNCINSGTARVDQFTVRSNFSEYDAKQFIA